MRFLKYITMNVLHVAALWFGLVEGIEGALNVGLFLCWTAIVISPFLLSEHGIKALATKGAAAPQWLDTSLDMVIISLLVWHGWTWTAAFFLLHTIIILSARNQARAKMELDRLSQA